MAKKVNQEPLSVILKNNKKTFRETDIHNIELLGTLDYLINETSKDNLTMLSKIISYIEKNYQVKSRNERIKHDLDELYEHRDILKHNLHIDLRRVEVGDATANKASYKYYVDNKGLDDEQILTIVDCIRNYKFNETYSSESRVETMFLNAVANKKKQAELSAELGKIDKSFFKGNKKYLEILRYYQSLRDNKNLVYIDLKTLTPELRNLKSVKETRHVNGYIYKVMEYNKKYCIVLIELNTHNPYVIPINKIEKLDSHGRSIKDLNEIINLDGYDSIDEFIFENKEVKGHSKLTCKIKFTEHNLKYIKMSYENYFKRKLEYKLLGEYKFGGKLYEASIRENPFVMVGWFLEEKIINKVNSIGSMFILNMIKRKLEGQIYQVERNLKMLEEENKKNILYTKISTF